MFLNESSIYRLCNERRLAEFHAEKKCECSREKNHRSFYQPAYLMPNEQATGAELCLSQVFTDDNQCININRCVARIVSKRTHLLC